MSQPQFLRPVRGNRTTARWTGLVGGFGNLACYAIAYTITDDIIPLKGVNGSLYLTKTVNVPVPPRLRASNEALLTARVPRAGDTPGRAV